MLHRFMQDLPVTRKLILIMVLTSVIAVLVASALFGVTDAISYRNAVATNTTTLAKLIGTNSTAAITFEDETLAQQVLMSLAADDAIEHAEIHTRDGRVLATYKQQLPTDSPRPGSSQDIQANVELVATTGEAQQKFMGLSYMSAIVPIIFDQEIIGVIYLRASLHELAATLQRIVFVACGAVLFAVLIAIFVSARLQAFISRPIVDLSNLMRRVSREQNYNLRASPSGADEIGALMSGFNEMLAHISSKDEKLGEANTRLTKAVRATLEAKDAAVSASRAKSDFLARMSHEIRTPMNGVLGMTELLLSSDIKATERKFAQTIRQSGETLLAVINDILDFSKIEAGKLTLDEVAIDLVDVVEEIVDLLYSTSQAKSVELISAINPETRTNVRGDPVRLRQILMNLVGNAIKFTHSGEIVVRLSEADEEMGMPGFRFEVTDTGIGIEQNQLHKIFDSFAQADVSTTREYGGTGLGLAITIQLVELMGGEIGVDSVPGKGSTFWFTLPLKVSSADASDSGIIASLAGIRALVVDDNPTNREILKRQLGAWGIDVVSTPCADDAIIALEQPSGRDQKFDIVLLNYFISGRDGISLAHQIRKRVDFGRPGILMLSSAGSEYDVAAMRKAGVDLYIAKPVRRAVLYESVVRVLQGAQMDETIVLSNADFRLVQQYDFDIRVLLVEDIPINMEVARHMLTAVGCEVIEATNGQEALDAIDIHEPDLVFMDCQMPFMDGYTATRKQRQREQDTGSRIPIIALTANAQIEDKRKCLEAGMSDFISKPFTRDTLVETVSQYAESKVDAADDAKPSGASSVKDEAPTETPNEPPNESSIEPAALAQIADLDPDNGNQLVCNIIETYLDSSDTLLSNLISAGRDNHAENVAAAAHSLKSSSANVGANRLAAMCSAIESAARGERLEVLKTQIDAAQTEYAIVAEELRSKKQGLAA